MARKKKAKKNELVLDIDPKDKLEVVLIFAEDWCYHASDQAPRLCDFETIDCCICGLLIDEDEDKVVVAHHWFPGMDDVRHVSVITKRTIKEMFRLSLDGVEPEEL